MSAQFMVAMRGWLLVPALAALAAAADPAPRELPAASPEEFPWVPRCSDYSLVGIRVGMPIGEAQATTPGDKWRPYGKPENGRQMYWVRTKKDGRPLHVIVTVAGGAVDDITVNYAPATMKAAFSFGLAGLSDYDQASIAFATGLQDTFAQRFGTPTWRGGVGTMGGFANRTVWTNAACDRVVLIDFGNVNRCTTILNARIAHASTWQAELDAGAAFAPSAASAIPAAPEAPAPAAIPEPSEDTRAPMGEAARAPDCSTCSLEGILLGMSVGEAQAVTQDAKWRKIGKPINGRQYYYVVREKEGAVPRMELNVWFAGEAVDVLEVNYLPITSKSILTGGPPFVSPAALEQAATTLSAVERELNERFGAPTSKDQASPDGSSRIVWTNAGCDRVVVMEHGLLDGGYGRCTKLRAVLAHASTMQAELDAGASEAKP